MKCCCLKLFLLCKIHIKYISFFNQMLILKLYLTGIYLLFCFKYSTNRYFLFLVKLLYEV